MAPDPLFERLQRALSPDYRLERELGRGGMGIAYVAHDITLNRDVAVKIIRPELATAHAAEAFLREARILASIDHPNVITIHRPGEGEGLHYYVMELVGGTTLGQRLEAAGPLALEHAVRVGKDLLEGLEAVHHAGVVHRDIKPSNIFLLPKRAILADFGIASPPSGVPRTTQHRPAHAAPGTPGYMAPEQVAGDPVTPRTDLYSAAAVIYEAITGRRYPPLGEEPSWEGIPYRIARVLRHALRDAPEDRWPDARTFRRALWRAYVARYAQRAAILATAGVALGAGAVALAFSTPSCGSAVSIALPRFDYFGPAAHRAVADSLSRLVRARLSGHPDFCVTAARRVPSRGAGGLLVAGQVTVRDSTIVVELADLSASAFRAPLAEWPALRDSLTYRVLLAVWDAKSPLAPSLPVRALPRTAAGLERFIEAEQFVAGAQWENAYRAYVLARETDSTCWLCDWRLTEVERWLGREHDPVRVRRYLARADSFGPLYSSLIHAPQLPLPRRLDALQAVTQHWRDVFLGWFQLGDELFHRGPLAGRARAEAIPPLESAARRRPDFAPAWEHLAWAYIAEGDSASAAHALDSLERRGSIEDRYAAGLRSLLRVAFAWRFFPEPVAAAATQRALADPVAGAFPDLGAGPRLLGSFDVPAGQVALGQLLAGNPAHDLRRSGLIAAVLGSVALGRPARARTLTAELTAIAPDHDVARLAAELDAALAFAESDTARPDAWARIARRFAGRGGQTKGGAVIDALLRADSLARAGAPAAALALTDTIDVEGTVPGIDPFYRTMAQLARARWRAAAGDLSGARRELLWHENNDLAGLPVGAPQAAEIDWAFGSIARWRLARLLDDGTGKACEAYRAVMRLWSGGEPLYQARADSARLRVRQLSCPPTT